MQQTEIDALKKACLYSLPPNKLGYCGPEKSWLEFQKFFSEPVEENASASRSLLEGFDALMPYLKLIAHENGLQPFDSRVIEAYWLGNSLLENVSFQAARQAILSLQEQGLPKGIAERKAKQLPKGLVPHHSMHVLYINFISQKVKPLVQNLSNCLVQWGAVKEPGETVLVKGIELFSQNGELTLKQKEKEVSNPLGVPLKKGDTVSIHWNSIVETLSIESLNNLKKYSFSNLEKVNLFLGGKKWT